MSFTVLQQISPGIFLNLSLLTCTRPSSSEQLKLLNIATGFLRTP